MAVGLVLAVTGVLFYPANVGAQQPVPWADAAFSGYATGTVVHADALQSGDVRLVNSDVAFSGATVNAGGIADRQLNEMDREVHASQPGNNSYARGSGLEVGVAEAPDGAPTVVLAGQAEAAAPPDTGPVTEEIGPVPGDPVAWASLVRGQAQARWNEDFCILGTDISRGTGFAADVQLVDTGGDDAEEGMDTPLLAATAPNPDRSVSESTSRTLLVPQAGGSGFGLATETRQTIAPVSLLPDRVTGEPTLTIEFLGEWVLRAVATGLPGGARVHYGPGEVSPETPILRFIGSDGPIQEILFQDLLGEEGLVVDLPGGLGQIAIGEDPRAIGGGPDSDATEAADGTVASGAVDVVRITLLEMDDQRLTDIRVGHMEVQAQVPVGGIQCVVPVQKTANPPSVQVGESFTTPITVQNVFNCDLTQVRVEDQITTVDGASFQVVSTDPQADESPQGTQTSATVVWNDIGPIPVGESRTASVTIEAVSGGRIDDVANATAVLDNCEGEGAEVAGVAVAMAGAGITGVSPMVQVPVGGVAAVVTPRTGPSAAAALLGGLSLLTLAGTSAYVRRRFFS